MQKSFVVTSKSPPPSISGDRHRQQFTLFSQFSWEPWRDRRLLATSKVSCKLRAYISVTRFCTMALSVQGTPQLNWIEQRGHRVNGGNRHSVVGTVAILYERVTNKPVVVGEEQEEAAREIIIRSKTVDIYEWAPIHGENKLLGGRFDR